MAQALPPATRLRLNQALQQWPQWHTAALQGSPKLIRPLGQGLSNHSFLVEAGSAQFVLRLSGAATVSHGLHRLAEWQAMTHAHAAGLAPAPRFLDEQQGVLVCDYVPPDAQQQASPAAVGALMRRIHALSPIAETLDIGERCAAAEHALANAAPQIARQLRPLVDSAAPLIKQLIDRLEPGTASALCHNDLLQSNRIMSTHKLWAIDWEYAAMGPVWFDLAATCAGDELNNDGRDDLLMSYLQRPATASDQEQLGSFECIYRYLEWLWHVTTNTEPAAAPLTLKLARLQGCLASSTRPHGTGSL